MGYEKDKKGFTEEKPAGSGAAKKGAKPPVEVPKEDPSYGRVMPEVTKECKPEGKK